ncbi:MAG: hypothetical protein MZV64_21865 [Ignavibacteriales bacterium]|nr:hypothetical protein [Ignavibacteriales bacterium]
MINDKKIDISDFPVSPLNLGKLINLIKAWNDKRQDC